MGIGLDDIKVYTPYVPPAPITSTPDPNKGVEAKKPTGVASLTVDGVDVTNGALAVHSVRAKPPVTPDAGIQSTFPLHDLSLISTEGRYAQGFRLDSGSLRMMWMSARRTQESDGTGSFQIFFQAHAGAVDRYKKRMEAAGAKPSSIAFHGGAPDPSAPADKAVLKKDGQKWSPSSSSKAIMLESPGKWQVEFVPGEPEAIKGAMSIRVFGNDAEATKALNEVISKLGLQSAFAPPDPKALERFKMLRLLWQIAPGAADQLRLRPREELVGLTELDAAAKEADPAAHAAIASADLAQPRTAERVKLAALLYDTSPKAFLAWAKSDSASSASGILPTQSGVEPNKALESALAQAGVAKGSAAFDGALAGTIDAKSARALLTLGLLATKGKGAEHVTREMEAVKLEQVQDLCASLGISEQRIANLRFDEVYPGYFTVVDPSLSEELYKHGARWLYSTSDNPERVHQMLTGGQKASLTRFQEGILIQGKSSSRDFETGGASSVFTRLVTETAIQTFKNKPDTTSSYSYGSSDKGWNDWGGSRPYKLIINRSILDRTDWYGFNGDNFGRTTNLKPENHGIELVRTIDGKFSTSNEVCFPIGNDTAYVDYVACSTDAQKKALVDYLASQGMTEWHGKPLEDFVIVAPKLMDHPDDVTLQTAVRDAITKNGLAEAAKAAEPVAKTAVEAALAGGLTDEAKTVAAAQVQEKGRSSLESNINYNAQTYAREAVNAETALIAALDVAGVKEKLGPSATAAAKEAARAKLEEVGRYSTYSLDSEIKNKVSSSLQVVADQAAAAALAEVTAQIGVPADKTPETRQAVSTQIETAVRAAVRAAVEAAVKSQAAEAAQAKAETIVGGDSYTVSSAAKEAAKKAAGEAAVTLAPAGSIDALVSQAEATTRSKLEAQALKSIESSGPGWIRSALKTALEAKATQLAVDAASGAALAVVTEQGKPIADATAKEARDQFATKFPAKVTPEEEAKIAATVQDALARIATLTAEKVAKQIAPTAVQKHVEDAAKAAFAEAGPALAAETAQALASKHVRDAAEAPLKKAADEVGIAAGEPAAKAAIEELKASVGAKLAEAALARVGEQLGNTWGGKAVTAQLHAAVEAVMAKVPS